MEKKRLPTFRDIYRGMRKPMASPTRVEGDHRENLRRRFDKKEIEEHPRRRKPHAKDREEP